MTTYTDDFTGETCEGVTVRELIALLEPQDPDAQVFFRCPEHTSVGYHPASALIKAAKGVVDLCDVDVKFSEHPKYQEKRPRGPAVDEDTPDLDVDGMFG